MAKQKEEKTNVMRVLEQKNIPYTAHAYDPDAGLDGVSVAKQLGQDPETVFKTLVARGASGGVYVKQYPTIFHETAEIIDSIMVSAGKIGFQVELEPAALMELVGASTADLTV